MFSVCGSCHRFLTAALPGTYDTDLLIISCIMPFVPGAAITNAVFDTLHGDYLSGLARAAEAFVIALAVAIGIGMGLFVMRSEEHTSELQSPVRISYAVFCL